MKTFILFIVMGLTVLTSCKNDENMLLGEQDEISPLTEQDKSDLLFLREEEKLARDVYIYSYNKYNQNIFSNISRSEQSHMDNVLNLLDKYDLSDPVVNNEVGVFSNSDLQLLYNELTTLSDLSIEKAMEVGANIEDLDIKDINEFISHTSNNDLLAVYSILNCGSRNHMRSFVRQLGTYTPTYISQAEYDAVITASNEQCAINN